MNKICNKCLTEKDFSDFHKNKFGKDGLRSICKTCCNLKLKDYYIKNKEEIIKNHKKYYNENKENILNYNKQLRQTNKIEINKKAIEKRQKNILHNFKCNIRSNFYHAFKNKKFNKSIKTNILLGCNYEEFKIYIENQFEDWMNWENYGGRGITTKNTNWDLDHIIPLSSVNSEEEIIKLCYYTNFQPLCSYINRYIKKNKIN